MKPNKLFLIEIILSIVLLHTTFNSQSQNIDTLINGIEYSIIKDTTSKTSLYSFAIKNKSKYTFHTEPFGLNINKVIVHNSIDQKIGYDFIACGNYERIIIEPDSSYTWTSELFEFIPDIYPFEIRGNQYDNKDSTYLLYWIINKNTIGPIKYYPEKDLVTNLSNSDNLIRDKSANFLRILFDKNLTTINPGHAREHNELYWLNKLSNLKTEMNVKQISNIFNIDFSEDRSFNNYARKEFQLDNSFLLTLIFNENYLLVNAYIYEDFRKIEYSPFDRCKNGFKNRYYINGQLLSKSFCKEGKLHGEQLYFKNNGVLIGKSIYKEGKIITGFNYNDLGILMLERNYQNSGTYIKISYDSEGNIISKKKHEKTKRNY